MGSHQSPSPFPMRMSLVGATNNHSRLVSCYFQVSVSQKLKLLFLITFSLFRWSTSCYSYFLLLGPSWVGEKQMSLQVGWTVWFDCILAYFLPSPFARQKFCTSQLVELTWRGTTVRQDSAEQFPEAYNRNDIVAVSLKRPLSWHMLFFYPEHILLLKFVYFVVLLPSSPPFPNSVASAFPTGDRRRVVTSNRK